MEDQLEKTQYIYIRLVWVSTGGKGSKWILNDSYKYNIIKNNALQ